MALWIFWKRNQRFVGKMDLNVGINYKNEMPKFTGEMSHFLPKKTLCSIYSIQQE
jgi:hypothetical protein